MRHSPTTVVALGGNAMLDPEHPEVDRQIAIVERVVEPIAELIVRGHRVVITHGNGPQVGFMALRSELGREMLHEVPLDALVANTQGSLGYLLQRALREALAARGRGDEVVTVLTEVEVDPRDEAFGHPTKPVGGFYTALEARLLEQDRGWTMVDDSHRGWRQVVPSPAPKRIVQLDIIRRLVDDGVVVICCGGGGIPVMRGEDGSLRGIAGVIDKDRTSAMLSAGIGARNLLLTTAVDQVYLSFGAPDQRAIDRVTVAEALDLLATGTLPGGSMGPKVKSAVRFLQHGGELALICKPDALLEALAGRAGTRVDP